MCCAVILLQYVCTLLFFMSIFLNTLGSQYTVLSCSLSLFDTRTHTHICAHMPKSDPNRLWPLPCWQVCTAVKKGKVWTELYGCNGSVINSSSQFSSRQQHTLQPLSLAATVGTPPELHNAAGVCFVASMLVHIVSCARITWNEYSLCHPAYFTHTETHTVWILSGCVHPINLDLWNRYSYMSPAEVSTWLWGCWEDMIKTKLIVLLQMDASNGG